MDLFTNMKPGKGTRTAYRIIRETVSHLDIDRVLSMDIAALTDLVRSGAIVDAVEDAVGPLN